MDAHRSVTPDSSAPRVLVVEDEPEMAGILTYILEDEGFLVTVARDGIQALQRLEGEPVDLVVLDHMPPGVDGFEVCQRIRARTTTPVLMLTALKESHHVVRGLELGADDYMTKPFNHRELILRIKSILKRTGFGQTSRPLEVGEIAINPSQRRVTVRGRLINVTPTEFKLLTCLAQHVGWVLAWQAILKAVWGAQDLEGGQDLVKVTVSRLRAKIEPGPEQPTYIQSVRGIGYRFAPPEPG
jgi:DNA-binding response OmpR family regulator